MNELPLGPLMIDLAGTVLTDVERERLSHPLIGGVILFARNYADPEQLIALCAEIHALRVPALPIAIDHEGGRVQRCRNGFTRIPAMRKLGEWWDRDQRHALQAAEGLGYILAAELRARGVDLSFAPVLDLDWGRSGVIGDRAFHRDAEATSALAGALIYGLRAAGMIACGKHFPGHGWVEADSHIAIPVDERDFAALQTDMLPYRRLALDAVMPAHVIYTKCDAKSAGFSKYWINILRNDFKFRGVIFSDDLSMEGASVVGDILARAEAAHDAGCDMLLVCNAPDAASRLLAEWRPKLDPAGFERRATLLPRRPALNWEALQSDSLYRASRAYAAPLLE